MPAFDCCFYHYRVLLRLLIDSWTLFFLPVNVANLMNCGRWCKPGALLPRHVVGERDHELPFFDILLLERGRTVLALFVPCWSFFFGLRSAVVDFVLSVAEPPSVHRVAASWLIVRQSNCLVAPRRVSRA
jgi:hypothetical protein